MLTELFISNFAIIENQSISFGEGLNVITGETGSGKSIILNALELILGGRSSSTYIRSGADALEVQAHFEVPHDKIETLPDFARTEQLVVSRTLSANGKGKVYINGNLGTVALLSDIGNRLISICGQSNHVRLLEPAYHLELLDGFARNGDLLSKYKSAFAAWSEREAELQRRKREKDREGERREELEAIIAELSPLSIRAGLREELEGKVKRLGNSQRLISGLHGLMNAMSDPEGVNHHLSLLTARLSELHKIDPALAPLVELFNSAKTELNEFERQLGSHAATIESDEETFEILSEKLAEIARLERKYRMNDEALAAHLESSKTELNQLGNDETFLKLTKEVETLRKEAERLGEALTRERKSAASKLSKNIESELRELNMEGSKFVLDFKETELTSVGREKIEFLISTNKGEDPKPLKHVASGGELSRVMLVLKKILRERSGVNVLVFDEVDAGISGSVARAVGQKLSALAENSQVICVTHLAQVASFADKHFLVDKTSGTRTVSKIRELKGEEIVNEIARMLAGFTITSASRESARELLSSK